MARPTSYFRTLSGIFAVGQLGISLIVPILLFTGLGVYLTERFSVGAWLTVLCVVVGVVTAGCTFYRVAREFLAGMRAQDKPLPGTDNADGGARTETGSTGAARETAVRRQDTNGTDAALSTKNPGADAAPSAENTGAASLRLPSGDAPTDHRHPGGDHI